MANKGDKHSNLRHST